MNAARAVVSVLLLVVGAMIFAGPLEAVDCLRPVGELPDGPALAADIQGRLAVFGRGRVLVLADLTDPSSPVELGSVVLPGVVGRAEPTATHAWTAAGAAGLIGVDLPDPSHPEIVSFLPPSTAGEQWVAARPVTSPSGPGPITSGSLLCRRLASAPIPRSGARP